MLQMQLTLIWGQQLLSDHTFAFALARAGTDFIPVDGLGLRKKKSQAPGSSRCLACMPQLRSGRSGGRLPDIFSGRCQLNLTRGHKPSCPPNGAALLRCESHVGSTWLRYEEFCCIEFF